MTRDLEKFLEDVSGEAWKTFAGYRTDSPLFDPSTAF